ncbi:DUF2164 domain-containing protein [Tenuibacillus multivorans]|uniref:Uncharacterized conserved protein, DUF2164 family n=1 Tax=Tenuibacillus multivorans TaxID=237069 RepID=A0A1H0FJD1_9BACI|nr:DUF2164 domain-containing protein [Tenuibacillus multivorans]GEL77689.1 hypothetical protein TMU01_19240 [Tenuibacillus multivorans]SDN94720.1 Uncharacterized conserved protein, DUF2164 family [Tenuibacillus multivorans]
MLMKVTREQKRQMIDQIKTYFYQERSEEIGDLAAENFLDFMSKEIAPHFYNHGLNDAKDVLEQKMMNLDEDIKALERST